MLSHPRFFARFFIKVTGFTTTTVIAMGLLAALPASARADSKAMSAPAATIEITYVANEGFLISDAGRKVLIDGIFTEGFGRFYTPTAEILNKERNALPPFDHLDALLVSHYHPDHINPADVVQHLANDRQTVLIGPPQVNDLLKPINGYEAIAQQILIVSPGSGDAIESSVRDIKIKSVALQHMNDAERKHQNLGFLLSLGGFKLFHVGDAGVNDVAEYKNLKLAGENIDIAFLSHFWFDNENVGNAREIIGDIKPKAIVLMHMNVGKADDYRNRIGKMNGLPPVYMAESPMEAFHFQLAAGVLSADHSPLQQQANPAKETWMARGPYFGQKPPGETPEIFAPELLSARYGFVARLAFSPDGTECCFTVTDATFSKPRLLFTKREGDVWTIPAAPPFTLGRATSHEPFFSKDGQKLYFSSDGEPSSPTNKRDLWVTERTPEGWSEPSRLPPPINSDYRELFFSQAADGTVYFVSNRPGGLGGFDLYRTRQEPGQSLRVENLGASLNSPDDEWDPCIAPDGSFLVFASTRPGGRGGSDLYVSFNDGHGGWTDPINLGEKINAPDDEYAPALSLDGQFLFFSRHNGKRCDVMWVRADVLERFRSEPGMSAVPETVMVPRGNAPLLDGVLSPDEWNGARRFEIPGGEVLLMHADGNLYVGLRTTAQAVGSICIDQGDQIAVLHSSAALGTATYARSETGWRLSRKFAWRCRNKPDAAQLQAERTAFWQDEHWLANNALTGKPGEMEYRIAMPSGSLRLAVTFSRIPDRTLLFWPQELADDSRNRDLIGGNAPETLQFSPKQWITVRASP